MERHLRAEPAFDAVPGQHVTHYPGGKRTDDGVVGRAWRGQQTGAQKLALHLEHLGASIQRQPGASTRSLDERRTAVSMAGGVHTISRRHRGKIGVLHVHPRCGGGRTDNVAMLQLFGIDQPSRGSLEFPAIRRFVPEAARYRISLSEIEVPPVLVRFAAVEPQPPPGPVSKTSRTRN